MPNMSDSARKRFVADWVVKTKKQVVKLELGISSSSASSSAFNYY